MADAFEPYSKSLRSKLHQLGEQVRNASTDAICRSLALCSSKVGDGDYENLSLSALEKLQEECDTLEGSFFSLLGQLQLFESEDVVEVYKELLDAVVIHEHEYGPSILGTEFQDPPVADCSDIMSYFRHDYKKSVSSIATLSALSYSDDPCFAQLNLALRQSEEMLLQACGLPLAPQQQQQQQQQQQPSAHIHSVSMPMTAPLPVEELFENVKTTAEVSVGVAGSTNSTSSSSNRAQKPRKAAAAAAASAAMKPLAVTTSPGEGPASLPISPAASCPEALGGQTLKFVAPLTDKMAGGAAASGAGAGADAGGAGAGGAGGGGGADGGAASGRVAVASSVRVAACDLLRGVLDHLRALGVPVLVSEQRLARLQRDPVVCASASRLRESSAPAPAPGKSNGTVLAVDYQVLEVHMGRQLENPVSAAAVSLVQQVMQDRRENTLEFDRAWHEGLRAVREREVHHWVHMTATRAELRGVGSITSLDQVPEAAELITNPFGNCTVDSGGIEAEWDWLTALPGYANSADKIREQFRSDQVMVKDTTAQGQRSHLHPFINPHSLMYGQVSMEECLTPQLLHDLTGGAPRAVSSSMLPVDHTTLPFLLENLEGTAENPQCLQDTPLFAALQPMNREEPVHTDAELVAARWKLFGPHINSLQTEGAYFRQGVDRALRLMASGLHVVLVDGSTRAVTDPESERKCGLQAAQVSVPGVPAANAPSAVPDTFHRAKMLSSILKGALADAAVAGKGHAHGPIVVVCRVGELLDFQDVLQRECEASVGSNNVLRLLPYYGDTTDREILRSYMLPENLYSPRSHSIVVLTHVEAFTQDLFYLRAIHWHVMVLDQCWGLLSNKAYKKVRGEIASFSCRHRIISCSTLRSVQKLASSKSASAATSNGSAPRITSVGNNVTNYPDISSTLSMLMPTIWPLLESQDLLFGKIVDGEFVIGVQARRLCLQLLAAMTVVYAEPLDSLVSEELLLTARSGGPLSADQEQTVQLFTEAVEWSPSYTWDGVSLQVVDAAHLPPLSDCDTHNGKHFRKQIVHAFDYSAKYTRSYVDPVLDSELQSVRLETVGCPDSSLRKRGRKKPGLKAGAALPTKASSEKSGGKEDCEEAGGTCDANDGKGAAATVKVKRPYNMAKRRAIQQGLLPPGPLSAAAQSEGGAKMGRKGGKPRWRGGGGRESSATKKQVHLLMADLVNKVVLEVVGQAGLQACAATAEVEVKVKVEDNFNKMEVDELAEEAAALVKKVKQEVRASVTESGGAKDGAGKTGAAAKEPLVQVVVTQNELNEDAEDEDEDEDDEAKMSVNRGARANTNTNTNKRSAEGCLSAVKVEHQQSYDQLCASSDPPAAKKPKLTYYQRKKAAEIRKALASGVLPHTLLKKQAQRSFDSDGAYLPLKLKVVALKKYTPTEERDRSLFCRGNHVQVVICFPGRQRFLGSFHTLAEAEKAYYAALEQRSTLVTSGVTGLTKMRLLGSVGADKDHQSLILQLPSFMKKRAVTNSSISEEAEAEADATELGADDVKEEKGGDQEGEGGGEPFCSDVTLVRRVHDQVLIHAVRDMLHPLLTARPGPLGDWEADLCPVLPSRAPPAFAKLQGPHGFVAYVHTRRSCILGRFFNDTVELSRQLGIEDPIGIGHGVGGGERRCGGSGLLHVDIHLGDDSSIARQHADIRYCDTSKGFQLCALHPSADVFVQGERVLSGGAYMAVAPGSVIQLGSRIFRFLYPKNYSAVASATTANSAAVPVLAAAAAAAAAAGVASSQRQVQVHPLEYKRGLLDVLVSTIRLRRRGFSTDGYLSSSAAAHYAQHPLSAKEQAAVQAAYDENMAAADRALPSLACMLRGLPLASPSVEELSCEKQEQEEEGSKRRRLNDQVDATEP